MSKLSDRLAVASSFIDDNDKSVIDIGCDHALVSIYLAKKYEKMKIIASDVNENALSSAISNIKKNNLEERIETRLGNGLDVICDSDKIDTILIAGMGANTIVGILKYAKNKLGNVKKIVIQSNTDLYFLRKNMMILGYYIADEVLVKDKGIIYTVIMFKKGKKRYSYRQLYLGPILIEKKGSLFEEKNSKEIKTNKMILNSIKSGHYLYRWKIKKNIRILENMK